MFQLVFTFPSQLCFGGWYFCWQSWVGLLAGDPVDLVRQQDQHDPPGRLRRAHQVGGGAGTRLVSLLSFLLRIHNISRWIPTIQWEMETFPASSLNLDRQSNEKASNLTLLFANHAQLSVSPTRLLFHSSETAGNFSGFSGQNFLPQFTLLTVSGSPQRSRLSELLTVCCGCFRKKSVALEFRLRFKLFPVRLVNVLERGNPLIEKVKFNPSVQLVIWNNEQGISYHKLYQKNEWVCQKFWGLINQHLPTCTSLRNRRTVWTLNNCII